MEFRKLTIHNLASIEDAVIDFEHGPLSEDTRFLICGPTGSGKTTILDAICLALYGTTPRLNIRKVEGYIDEYENFKLSKDREDIKIDDTRMLMRRGSLNAFVEIIFTDKDDHALKAIWQCNRAHNKIDGNIKDPEWLLFDLEKDVILCDKKSTTLKEITERIGLSFEQFCRTTMLAQGDFTKFLKSDEGEKSQILEKLTGTQIYSSISMFIHAKKNEKENACQQISSKMEGVQLLSEEDKNEIGKQINDIDKKIQNLKIEENIINDKIQWISLLSNYIKGINEDKNKLRQQIDYEESTSFKEQVGLIEDWQKTQVVRDAWCRLSEIKKNISEKNNELNGIQRNYQRLSLGLRALEKKLDEKKKIQEKIKNYLEQETPYEKSYKEITLIESLATLITENRSFIDHSKKVIQSYHSKLKDLKESYDKQITCVKNYEFLQKKFSNDIGNVAQQISQLNYAQLLKERETLDTIISDLKEYQLLVKNYRQLQGELILKKNTINEFRASINRLEIKYHEAMSRSKELEQQVNNQKKIYDKQQLACSNIMQEYRETLHVGDVCPLCGQLITEIQANEHFISILQPVKEYLEKLQADLHSSSKSMSEEGALLKVTQQEFKRKETEYNDDEKRLKELDDLMHAHPMASLFTESSDLLKDIQSVCLERNKALTEVNKQLQEIGVLQQKLNQLQLQKQQNDNQLQEAEKILQNIEKQQIGVKEACSAETLNIQKSTSTIEQKIEELASYVEISKYDELGNLYIHNLRVGADRYKVANDKAQSVEVHIREIQNELELIYPLKKNIEEQQVLWKQSTDETPILIDHLSQAWIDLQTSVSKITETIHIAEKQAVEQENILKSYFSDVNSVSHDRFMFLVGLQVSYIESLNRQVLSVRDQRIKLAAQVEANEHRLQEHQLHKPMMDDGTTQEMLVQRIQILKNEINENNQLLGKFKQQLESDHRNSLHYATIQKELSKATDDLNKWIHLHKLFGSNDGKKFRNIAQSFVLEQLLANANQYLCRFTHRYELECQPGSLTILLRDNEAGGILRPTTTISGGESFLISLSLALGLSTLSRSSMSMDILFIDEGFGTLDSTYLSAVMDALDKLHQIGGKKIGIISHVENLKERLTTQIQVSRVNNTLSKVNVVSLL